MSTGKPSGPAAEPPPALLRALRHLLRPVVRLGLAHQITHPALARMLKSVYVDVARAELAKSGERESASRISLATGVHRKDLRVLLESPGEAFEPPGAVSLGARLVRRWTEEAAFRDGRGRPRPLPRAATDAAGGASFEDLVAGSSTDIRPRAVLDEWLRLGVVEIDAKDRVRLRVEGFVPTRGYDEKAHYFGRNLHDHIAAAAHNLEGGEPPMLERSVYYEGLTPESVEELSSLAEREGMKTLRALNRRAAALKRRDAKRTGNRFRFNFGVFLYRGENADEPGDGGADD